MIDYNINLILYSDVNCIVIDLFDLEDCCRVWFFQLLFSMKIKER